ncbi:DUF2809 domain-containing protein [Seonamhaeicola algicola]|uniref:DUF2809 domain-containing protein n=1 Tax=Seonamhaeicola algicola TaxID=1719036 RepID=A0A5C7AJZ3_9FLAO|nr:DUF2809 domain-containing protein [Seonamhaeicola algicola]TXE08109.1 DUF2809 domain-containing protein [Seonamhaeicola algicola]
MYLKQTYIIFTLLLFITEVVIACFVKTSFIRHTFGDYLVVILLYCFIKCFITKHNNTIALCVLAFSFFVELLQLIRIVDIFKIKSNIVKIIIGTTFEVSDLIAYTLGICTVLIFENRNVIWNKFCNINY